MQATKAGPEQRQAPRMRPRERMLQRARRGRRRRRGPRAEAAGSGAHACHLNAHGAASEPPITCTSVAEAERTAVRRTAACRRPRTRRRERSPFGEVAQHLRVGVGDAHEGARTGPARASGARPSALLGHHEVARGDRVAVGIARGVARAWPRSAPRAPRRGRARAPRPRRGPGPTARRATAAR